MPSSRRTRLSVLAALLTLVIILYVSTGASSTQNSAFYQRTVAALKEKQSVAEQQDMIAEEKVRNDRVKQLQKEHDFAMEKAQQADTPADPANQPQRQANHQRPTEAQQKPITPPSPPSPSLAAGEKSVAGRKKVKDDKRVQGKPATAPDEDGVAKVGNIAPQPSNAASGYGSQHSEEDHKVETAMNEILKKGPIVIFSKSYCPFSKKAKHILLDMYTISPPPYVVELDQHELGPGLQAALTERTGRRTVPNILINGKSIGGGDEIEALHNSGKITETVLNMGGKRIMKADKIAARQAAAVPFRA